MKELKRLSEFPVTMSRSGIVFKKSLSDEQWRALGVCLLEVGQAFQWAMGDWLNYGRKKHGSKYSLAVEILERKYGTVRHWCLVAKTFEMFRRAEHLTFSHHAAIADFGGLTVKQQDTYLMRAERDGLTVPDLRELIRSDLADASPGALSRVDPPSPLKYLTEFTLSIQRLGNPQQWPKPQREAWKRELLPLVELYQSL